MAHKKKTWHVAGMGVEFDHALLEKAHPDFHHNFAYRMRSFCEFGSPVMRATAEKIASLNLRRPYHGISFEVTPDAPGPPEVRKRLIDTALVVPVQRDLHAFLDTPETDEALSELFISCVVEGLERVGPDKDILRPAIVAGIAELREANYFIKEGKPDRTRVVGAELLMEVGSEFSPTQRICHMRFWRPGKPKVAFTRSFIVPREPINRDVVRMYILTPVQGAVRTGDVISLGRTSYNDGPQNGMTPNPEVADQSIPLAEIEAITGPIKRLSTDGRHLRLV